VTYGILLLLLLLLLLTANGFIPGGSVLQCKAGQYNTIAHITQNNTHRTKLHTTLKAILNTQNYKKKSGTQYTIKTQKRVELTADESVLKTTIHTKL